MRNTIGDIAVTNTSRKTNYFRDLRHYLEKRSSPFLSFRFVLSMFLNFGNFLPSCSHKKASYKKRVSPAFKQMTRILSEI